MELTGLRLSKVVCYSGDDDSIDPKHEWEIFSRDPDKYLYDSMIDDVIRGFHAGTVPTRLTLASTRVALEWARLLTGPKAT